MDKYEEMALKLIDYELKRFDHWKAETEHSLPLLMKRPLLALLTSEKPHLQVTFGLYHSLTVAYSLMLNFTILYILQPLRLPVLTLYNHCFFKDTPHRTPLSTKNKMRFVVNFAPEIQEIISEATYLGLLGYTVPTVALNVALQDYKLIRY